MLEETLESNQLLLALALAICIAGKPALAEDGVTDGKIVVARLRRCKGLLRPRGQGMRPGILAALDAANRSGGVSRSHPRTEVMVRRL